MKINLIDPALRNKVGHHYDLDLKIANELLDQGHEVIIYSNHSFIKDSTVKTRIKIIPTFSKSPYDTFNLNSATNQSDEFKNFSNLYASELKKVLPAELIIVPTMFSFLLNSFTAIKTKTPIAACIMRGPELLNLKNSSISWRIAFDNAQDKLLLNLGGLESISCDDYLPLIRNKKFNIFPLPYDGLLLNKPKIKIQTVGFFGHQRIGKGLIFFKPLIEYLISKNLSITFHDSSNKIIFNHHGKVYSAPDDFC
jgi:hypothetical protein